ncbi:MAG: hypothetical protein PHP42_13540, partial [Bacteroidota bacterium]|nr:hypothetical protein [Bacteroidota bacterium]
MMKTKFFLLFFLFLTAVHAQPAGFPSVWKFTTTDSAAYASSAFNDSSWANISVPSQWESQGFANYDGVAWYRTKFSVPKKMLRLPLLLLAGKIDDADETYLNGMLIGATGKFPPNAVSEWSRQRAYKIPAGVLKENNVLAVRVYDGGGPGGIIGSVMGIFTKKEYIAELNLGPAPKKSWHKLTTSNGLIAAVYDEKKNAIETALPHIFQAYDSGKAVRAFAMNIHPKISAMPKTVSYEANTHVIRTDFGNFSIYYFAPFTTQEKILYAVVRGKEKEISEIEFEFHSGFGEMLTKHAERKEKNGTAEKYFLFSFNDSLHNNTEAIDSAAKRISAEQTSVVDDEIHFMKNIFSSCTFPKGLSKQERNIVEQSISVLKMSQVGEAEIFPHSRGQVLASLPPGVWNIAWVRDGRYAIGAMVRLGMFTEAKRALRFMLTAPSGQYKNFIHTDGKEYGIGVDYQISVCRYFGNGREESDFNDQGPNIEIDGFGLTLSAIAEYLQYSKDTAFVREWDTLITAKIADAILYCIAPNNLIRNESGPWERHLPGKQYAYTSASCAEGLFQFAKLHAALNLGSQKYFDASQRLKEGILSHLIYQNTFIKGNEEGASPKEHEFMDGQTFEGFAIGLLTDTTLFTSHMRAYNKELRVKDPKRGYIRINSADWYECQEWLFLDARLAVAQLKFGNKKEAQRLLNWITSQSALNFNLIPEMYG